MKITQSNYQQYVQKKSQKSPIVKDTIFAFLIGGASVYAEGLPLADRLCLTHIHHTPAEADAFFPPFEARDWTVSFSESHPADEKNEQPYTFTDYVRKK